MIDSRASHASSFAIVLTIRIEMEAQTVFLVDTGTTYLNTALMLSHHHARSRVAEWAW